MFFYLAVLYERYMIYDMILSMRGDGSDHRISLRAMRSCLGSTESRIAARLPEVQESVLEPAARSAAERPQEKGEALSRLRGAPRKLCLSAHAMVVYAL